VATPNYSYEKRQRELAKKRKQEEKRQKKTTGRPEDGSSPEIATDAASTGDPVDGGSQSPPPDQPQR
jgi:hypothetical protein